MAKKNNELREQIEAIKNEKKALEEMLKCKKIELKHSKAKEEKLQDQLASKGRDFNMLVEGSCKLFNILLQNKRSLCKLGLGGDNHNGEFNKSLKIVKASIQLSEGF